NGAAPHVLGAHLEGPFIAPERLGTHPVSARRDPDRALLERLLTAGRVTHVTLAPELPGAFELIELLRARGITVSCGHSNATAGAGLGEGRCRLGSVDGEITGGVVRRGGSVLAGSSVSMIDAVRNLVALGASVPAALSAATEVPARIAGRDDVGRLEPGAEADVVV